MAPKAFPLADPFRESMCNSSVQMIHPGHQAGDYINLHTKLLGKENHPNFGNKGLLTDATAFRKSLVG